MVINDEFYMQLCLNEAWKYQALTYPNPPVGALILDKHGKILSIEAHQEARQAHAELNAAIQAVIKLGDTKITKLPSPGEKHSYLCENYQNYFQGCTIYVTLEPCMHHGSTPPCSILIKSLGFTKVVIGTLDPNPMAKGGKQYLIEQNHEVLSGILKKECNQLLYPFIKWQMNKNFVFFKLAKFQNGTITGKHVSSLESRKLVHKIRTKIDLLVIGGDTVRNDRPTLDCRLVDSQKVPDILIITSDDNLDREIPLFKVPNRKVYIKNDFKLLENYKHIMIEGGEGMFVKSRDIVDFYLFFTSPKTKTGKTIQIDANLKSLHCFKNSSDTITWLENIR